MWNLNPPLGCQFAFSLALRILVQWLLTGVGLDPHPPNTEHLAMCEDIFVCLNCEGEKGVDTDI